MLSDHLSTIWDPAVTPQRAVPTAVSPLVHWPSLGGLPQVPSQPWRPPMATQRQQDLGGGGSRATAHHLCSLGKAAPQDSGFSQLEAANEPFRAQQPSGSSGAAQPHRTPGTGSAWACSFQTFSLPGQFSDRVNERSNLLPSFFCHYLRCTFLTGLC